MAPEGVLMRAHNARTVRAALHGTYCDGECGSRVVDFCAAATATLTVPPCANARTVRAAWREPAARRSKYTQTTFRATFQRASSTTRTVSGAQLFACLLHGFAEHHSPS